MREVTIRWGMIESPFEMWGQPTPGYRDTPWYPWHTPLEHYNRGKYFYNKRYHTQALSLSYTQELKRWLALSINASYSGSYQNQRIAGSERVTDTYRKHRFALYPTVRFTYVNSSMIRLYSGIGLGFGMKREKDFFTNEYKTKTYLTGQLTFIGISIGRNLFACWELGYGQRGFLTAGIGYRF